VVVILVVGTVVAFVMVVLEEDALEVETSSPVVAFAVDNMTIDYCEADDC
jgi:hypothetical protein